MEVSPIEGDDETTVIDEDPFEENDIVMEELDTVMEDPFGEDAVVMEENVVVMEENVVVIEDPFEENETVMEENETITEGIDTTIEENDTTKDSHMSDDVKEESDQQVPLSSIEKMISDEKERFLANPPKGPVNGLDSDSDSTWDEESSEESSSDEELARDHQTHSPVKIQGQRVYRRSISSSSDDGSSVEDDRPTEETIYAIEIKEEPKPQSVLDYGNVYDRYHIYTDMSRVMCKN